MPHRGIQSDWNYGKDGQDLRRCVGGILAIGEFAYWRYSTLIDISYPIVLLLLISLVFLVFLYVAIAANRRKVSLGMKRNSVRQSA